MKYPFRTTPCGDTIFCDDIRPEVTGKVTLVGVYASHIFVAAPFPTKLKLCLRVLYQEHADESDEPLQLQVYVPENTEGKPHFKIDVPTNFRKLPPRTEDENKVDAEDWETPDRVGTCFFHLELNDLPISKPGRIRVRMVRGDIAVRLGSLMVMQHPNADMTKFVVPGLTPEPA